jgi:hypothetical protein
MFFWHFGFNSSSMLGFGFASTQPTLLNQLGTTEKTKHQSLRRHIQH